MTKFYLIRHATYDGWDQLLAGRSTGFHLNTEGKRLAQALAKRLPEGEIRTIYSSPLERAVETAEIIGRHLKLEIVVRPELQDIEYGRWTGRRWTTLESDPIWRRFNTARSITRAPEGESLLDVQTRFISELLNIKQENANTSVAVVSHSDPIRSALAYVLGLNLDLIDRIEVKPASLSIVDVGDNWTKLVSLNN